MNAIRTQDGRLGCRRGEQVLGSIGPGTDDLIRVLQKSSSRRSILLQVRLNGHHLG